jgi:hypothetical protein
VVALVADSMASYSGLLSAASEVLDACFDEELDEEARMQVKKFVRVIIEYTRDEARLSGLVSTITWNAGK